MATHSISTGRSSQVSIPATGSMNLAKTLQVQDQIIEQLRADHAALKEALESERAMLRECRLANDRELKVFQRETLHLNKINKQQEMKIEELEKELAYKKEALASEQRNMKNYEKEQASTVKDLKIKMMKDFDKINKQEILIDQLKSEIEDLKEALNSERNATNLLIREHNNEVKMLREEVKTRSTEAYRELKERATREREEYKEMQEEAERTYKVLEKDFREALAEKDEELRRVKAEAKLVQKELEDQLRNSLKTPRPLPPPTPLGSCSCVDTAKFRRLKNEMAVMKEQNRRLLNEIQVRREAADEEIRKGAQLLTEDKPTNEVARAENYVIPYEGAPEPVRTEKKLDLVSPSKVKKSLACMQEKLSDVEITRLPSDNEFNNKNLTKRHNKNNALIRREEGYKPYQKTKTEERYEELKRTMMILRKALQ